MPRGVVVCCELRSARECLLSLQGRIALGIHKGMTIVGLQLQSRAQFIPGRGPCTCINVRHCDRLAEMGDRLLEGRAAQRLVARLAPPFDGEIVEPGLGEMMGDRLGLGRCAFRLTHKLRRRGDAAPGGGS